ncbi:DUF2379 family protein [Corallococcus exercitus]|uniref:DUF2379 family protein n=1 Tax=Corallococcus exercitus TaxID=2316736 RepID=A0A7Y4JU91_9BACT|nr:DUF2379 family protein [Corallococcus exercitus]
MTSDDWRKAIDLGLALANCAELPQDDPELPALLRRVAPQMGMSHADADAALASAPATAALVSEIHRRMREGSFRLGRAFGASDSLKENGDRAGALKVLEDAMAAEVVPLYRAQLQAYLDNGCSMVREVCRAGCGVVHGGLGRSGEAPGILGESLV